MPLKLVLLLPFALHLFSCKNKEEVSSSRIRVIFDTDANNELDDQHALAYLLFNQDRFEVEGVTVNATRSGGGIDQQYQEAERILRLCNEDSLPLLKGADASFIEILPQLDSVTYDGKDAVEFISDRTREEPTKKLTVIAVGKLTTLALTFMKDPGLVSRIRLVWLGSNYPEPGEYNLNNDTAALNFILNIPVDFEIVTVRYGKPSGTDAVKITQKEINEFMPGKGPKVKTPVTGRHGGTYRCFGDYSVSLFEHIDYHSDPPSRALFDMAAVAVVKDSTWAGKVVIPAPLLVDGQWVERPDNSRKITIWENFNKEAILQDFRESMVKGKR